MDEENTALSTNRRFDLCVQNELKMLKCTGRSQWHGRTNSDGSKKSSDSKHSYVTASDTVNVQEGRATVKL